MSMPDIDIDFADREKALSVFKSITASRIDNGNRVAHNTGVYLHKVPIDAPSGLCSTEYKKAEDDGYFKLDFLNVGIYKDVRDEDHLTQLMEKEPIWELLTHKEFSDKLFHVAGHSTLLKEMEPKSLEQLAACLAMIRPAKRNLVGQSWDTVMKNVWMKPTSDEYYFKKSHATAYALSVVVHMNLLCEQLNSEVSEQE